MIVGKASMPNQQSGGVTFTNTLEDSSDSGIPLTVNTTGTMTLNNNSSGIAIATGGSGSITLNSGSITVSQPTTSDIAEISTTGKVTIASAGIIGSSTNRLQFPANQNQVQITSSGAVYINGQGSLTLGAAGYAAVTNTNALLDVTTNAGGNLTFLNQVSTGSGDISLAPAGNIVMNYAGTAGTPSIASTGSNMTFSSPMVLGANTYISEGTGVASKTISFGVSATINDSTATHSFTIDAGSTNQASVVFSAPIGAVTSENLASFMVFDANTVSIANVGSSTIPQAGVTGVFWVYTTNSGITWTGTYYQTGAAQTWYTGGSLATPAPQNLSISSSATTWLTPAKLNMYGNLVSSGGAATLISNDIGLNPAGTGATQAYGSWNLGSNQLNFYAQSPSTLMMIGVPVSKPDTGGQWHLDQVELLSLNVANVASNIVFGQAGIQTGNITFTTVNLSTANVPIAVYTNGPSGGNISLDDGGTTNGGLDTGSANVTLTAGASILSVQAQNAYPEINTTGTINLDAVAGMIGGTGVGNPSPAGPPLQIQYYATTIINIQKNPPSGSTAPLGVWIEGIGNTLTLGTINVTGAFYADVNSSGIIYLTQNINTNGSNLTYNSPVRLRPYAGPGNTITITTGGGSVAFNSTFDDDNAQPTGGYNALTINTNGGTVTFTGPIGNATSPAAKPIGGLTIQKAGAVSFGANVSTAKVGTMTGAIRIDHTGLLSFGTGNPAWLLIGPFTELNSTSPYTGGSVNLQGTLDTTNNGTSPGAAITFNAPITLTGNTTVNSGTGTQVYQHGATIDSGGSPFSFATDGGTGTKTFGLAIGQTAPLSSFTVAGGSTVSLLSMATTGSQSVTGTVIDLNGNYTSTASGGNAGNIGFTGPVTLLGTTGVTTANSAISFSSTVSGAFGLTLNAAGVAATNGNVTLSGAVGSTPLSSFVVTNGNTVSLLSVATTGPQSVTGVLIDLNGTYQSTNALNAGNIGFTGPVTLLGTTGVTTANSAISFSSTVSGAFGLTLNAAAVTLTNGNVTISGAVGATPLTSFTVTNGNTVSLLSVATTGAQSVTGAAIDLNGSYQSTAWSGNAGNVEFVGPVTLMGTTGVTTADSAIGFSSTVDGAYGLTLDATGVTSPNGAATFSGIIGGSNPLATFMVSSSGKLTLNTAATIAGDFTLYSTDLDILGALNVGGTSTSILELEGRRLTWERPRARPWSSTIPIWGTSGRPRRSPSASPELNSGPSRPKVPSSTPQSAL